MEINTLMDKGNYIIALKGDLDASSSILLDDAIREGLTHNPFTIWIDCAELYYISSAGLGVFISHLQDFELKSIPLVLFSVRKPVENVFDVLGLNGLIPILPDREQAHLYCEGWHSLHSVAQKSATS